MTSNEIIEAVKQSFIELRNAEEELNRPLEDVVTLSACLNVRQSMTDMVRLYLQSKSVVNKEDNTLKELISECSKIDNQFGVIDLTNIFCKDHDLATCTNHYCLTTERVADCVIMANQLKVLIKNKLNILDIA